MSTHALYRFYNASEDLLYVGITLDPGSRWKTHSKEKPWWHEVARVEVQKYATRDTVLEAERAAIIAERPRYNVVHNGGSQPSHAAPILERTRPIQPGDWIALGLRDGRCPVGAVMAMDDEWLSVRLKEYLMGSLTNHVIAVRWSDVERVELAYLEDATKEYGRTVIDDEHLGDFQTGWTNAHLRDGDPVEQAIREWRREKREMDRT